VRLKVTDLLHDMEVQDEAAGDDFESHEAVSATTGLVIIAVVVCVVGTSLVWVVIIYKTRQRRQNFFKSNEASGSSGDSRSQSSGARSSLVGRGSTGSTSGGGSGGSHLHVHGAKRHNLTPAGYGVGYGTYDELAPCPPVPPFAWNYGGGTASPDLRPEMRRHSSGATINTHAQEPVQYVVGHYGGSFSKGSEMELLEDASGLGLQKSPRVRKPPLRVAEDTSKFSHRGAVTVQVLRHEAALASVGKPMHSSAAALNCGPG
jgi:hypothetical protein